VHPFSFLYEKLPLSFSPVGEADPIQWTWRDVILRCGVPPWFLGRGPKHIVSEKIHLGWAISYMQHGESEGNTLYLLCVLGTRNWHREFSPSVYSRQPSRYTDCIIGWRSRNNFSIPWRFKIFFIFSPKRSKPALYLTQTHTPWKTGPILRY
jgi:hypothetical protein